MRKFVKKLLKKKGGNVADEEAKDGEGPDAQAEPEGPIGSGAAAVDRPTHEKGLVGPPNDDDLSWMDADYSDEDFKAIVSRFKELVQDRSPEREIYRVAKNLMRIAKHLYGLGRLETAKSYAWKSVEVLERGSAS